LLSDFNILASTTRGNERQLRYELSFLFKEAGDNEAKTDKTGIKGLVIAKISFDPIEMISRLRQILQEKPYEFRYSLRIIPVEKVVRTNLEDIGAEAVSLAAKLEENDTFRVSVEKRFTNIHSREIIETVAANIKNKVDLNNPDRILLIEILGGSTGISLLKPADILSVLKEKMM
jgi:tRNA acetyltransferase TAN1